MAELESLQRQVAHWIMQPLGPGHRLQQRDRSGRGLSAQIDRVIQPNSRLTGPERLEIYNRQYWFRLWDCFQDDYPGLRALLGPRRFQTLASRYLEACPSSSFTLRNLGRSLVRYLEEHPQLTTPRTQLALEMARLEWAHVEAFDNAACPAVTPDDLLGTSPENVRLAVQPYITFLQFEHAVDDFLLAVKAQASALRGEASHAIANPRAVAGRSLQSPVRRIVYLAVHRFNDSVFYKRLSRPEFIILTALQRGTNLADACAAGFEAANVAADRWARQVQKAFSTWTSLGWFARPAAKGPVDP